MNTTIVGRLVFGALFAGTLVAVQALADGLDTGQMGQMGSHMHASPHVYLTNLRAEKPGDRARAAALLKTIREVTAKYQDSNAAVADGYQPFLPTVPQEVYHFVNTAATASEYVGAFDPARPGSLLYARAGVFGGGYRLVGVMFSANESLSEDDLDKRIPLSIGRWHAHVNICLPKGISLSDLSRGDIGANDPHLAGRLKPAADGGISRMVNRQHGFMADGRFGFEGTIADAGECEAAGGEFLKQAYGWMMHVYPFAGDDLKVAYGMDVP